MKRIITVFLAALIAVSALLSLASCKSADQNGNGKLRITASLFPQYDFAKAVAGDKAEVTLLLPPGTESHTYDPSAKDIYSINNCDIFLYTGENMEAWAHTVISGIGNENVKVVDVTEGIDLIKNEHDEDGEDEHDSHEHEHAYDPHVWLDPTLSVKIVRNIAKALCEKDSENADYYNQNAEEYIKKLEKLDTDIAEAVENASGDTLVFGGRFAYIYFIERYSLKYKTAYDSCSSETEPGLSRIYEISSFVKDNGIKYIFHEELSEAKVAKSIAENTGAECLTFSTAHNVTSEEFSNGVTYLDIMYLNLENVKKALDY